jgi:NTP pyrophosphatase (non-canonical NTP hydrolase)
MEPRKVVKDFAEAMEEQLRKNDHKTGWDDCSPLWLASRLVAESAELIEAIEDGNLLDSGRQMYKKAALREAADVANYAMMVWDQIQKSH